MYNRKKIMSNLAGNRGTYPFFKPENLGAERSNKFYAVLELFPTNAAPGMDDALPGSTI